MHSPGKQLGDASYSWKEPLTEEIILEGIATICLQKFVFMPRNELLKRSVKCVADVR